MRHVQILVVLIMLGLLSGLGVADAAPGYSPLMPSQSYFIVKNNPDMTIYRLFLEQKPNEGDFGRNGLVVPSTFDSMWLRPFQQAANTLAKAVHH